MLKIPYHWKYSIEKVWCNYKFLVKVDFEHEFNIFKQPY